ncbi:hypothetical protein TrVE_jg4342 [Triparma verrucosa]|uniref:Uncharacterized protein n=1 Tax=Triparma verrucosa TaxID=1606542 RepID=A0A9W7FP90_9STRA|nr:hypothetical protein TrVE_jg4342 [Triparma verrucosa]
MVAIWQSLRPPADKRKELKETPIPQDKLGVILPLWDHISTTMTTVKTNIDIAARELEKEQPNSLATAGASSAQLRCSKLLKTTKVRDLQKSMSAVVPALTKTNLAWAGIETQKDSKACQDLIPIIEGIVVNLKDVEATLQKIDRILNPKPGQAGFESPADKRSKKRWAKARGAGAFGGKKKERPKELEPHPGGVVSSSISRRDSFEMTPPATPTTPSFSLAKVRSPPKSQLRASYINVGGGKSVGKVKSVVRKLKNAKVVVNKEEQNEFGGDPVELLRVEREGKIGEGSIELGEYFSLRSEMRQNPGAFRPSTMSSNEIMSLMLAKPTTADANLGGTFVKKKGSKWGKLQAGVRGEVSPPPKAAEQKSGASSPVQSEGGRSISSRGSDLGAALQSIEGSASFNKLKTKALSVKNTLRSLSPSSRKKRAMTLVSSPSKGGKVEVPTREARSFNDTTLKGGGGDGVGDGDDTVAGLSATLPVGGGLLQKKTFGMKGAMSAVKGLSSTGLSGTKSILKVAERSIRSASGGRGATRERSGRSISFDIEEDAEGEEKKEDGRTSSPEQKRVSTAPGRLKLPLPTIDSGLEGDRGKHNHTAESYLDQRDKQLFEELEKERREFAKMQNSPSAINMDAFKAAFHESSKDAQRMEEEKKKADLEAEKAAATKKKKKKGGMFGDISFQGIKEAASKRYSMAKKVAKRAITPPKDGMFGMGRKKYVVSATFLTDEQILEDAINYWTKVKEGKTLADVQDSHFNQKSSPKKERSVFSLRSRKESRSAHESYKMDKAHGSLGFLDMNLGLAHFCREDEESMKKAEGHLLLAKERNPEDPTAYLRLGQIKSKSRDNNIKMAGLELLRKSHTMATEDNSLKENDAFLVESSAAFGAAAYSNSELKQATKCMDHLLKNAAYYVTDEAMVTKSQIMLRRGQYEDAQRFYSNLGNPNFADVQSLYPGEAVGNQQYVYPRMEGAGESVGENLLFTRQMRRRETLKGAAAAYKADPRHLSR